MLLVCGDASAQQAGLRGLVTGASDGAPLQGVHVVLTQNGAVLGAVTNVDGAYLINSIPPGSYVLRASFIGFDTYTDTLSLAPGESSRLDIALRGEQMEVGEIVVESRRTAGAARVTAGRQQVSPEDIDLIPTPGVSGDLVNYLSAQPGVVSMGDRGGQVFIRGGESTQNLTLLDGMPVYQPFHLLGFYSAFPSEIIHSASIHAGGFGAEYSGRLSSVIDVQTRNGSKRRHGGALSLSPFVSSLRVEGPLVSTLSFIGSARISTLEEVASAYVADDLPYRFGDVFGKLHATIASHHQTSITGLRTYDRGVLAEPTLLKSNNEVRWSNTALGVRHFVLPRRLPMMGEATFSYSKLETDFGPRDAPTRASAIESYHLEIDLTNFAGGAEVDWGFFIRTFDVSSNLGGAYQNVVQSLTGSTNAGAYVQPDIALGGGMQLRAGFVAQHFGSSGIRVEPRARAVLQRGPHEWSAAAGLYRQYIIGLSDRRDAANIFTAYTEVPPGHVPTAVHVLAGYRVEPVSWLEISLEGFYKRLRDLSIAEWTSYPRFTTRLQPATGRATGMDLRAEVRHARFYLFANYGLSFTRYEAMQESLPIWFGTSKLSFRPPHDRRHSVNLVVSATLVGFDLSARWNLGSGLPYTEVRGFDGFLLLDGFIDVVGTEGFPRVIYDRPFRGVLPVYHRLDITLQRRMRTRLADFTVQGGLVNAYNRRNLFSLDVFTLRRTDQLPLVATAGLGIEI